MGAKSELACAAMRALMSHDAPVKPKFGACAKTAQTRGKRTSHVRRPPGPTYPLYEGESSVSGRGAFAGAEVPAHALLGSFDVDDDHLVRWDHCLSCARTTRPFRADERDALAQIIRKLAGDVKDVSTLVAQFEESAVQTFCCVECDKFYADSRVRLNIGNSVMIHSSPRHEACTMLVLDSFYTSSDGSFRFGHQAVTKAKANYKLRLINEAPAGQCGNCSLVHKEAVRNHKRVTAAVVTTRRIRRGEELIMHTYGPNYEARDGDGNVYYRNDPTELVYLMIENHVMRVETRQGDAGKVVVIGDPIRIDGWEMHPETERRAHSKLLEAAKAYV